MKAFAYIFMVSLLILGAFPMISHLQIASEQTAACCDACCCDAPKDACAEEGQEKSDHSCDAGCDCGCQFHLNAVQFQFNNLQLAEEQEYFYGEYHNDYSFEYLRSLIHPPRFA